MYLYSSSLLCYKLHFNQYCFLKDKICACLLNALWCYTLTVLEGTSQYSRRVWWGDSYGKICLFSQATTVTEEKNLLFRLWQKHMFFLTPAHPTLAANSSRANLDWLHVCWANFSSVVLKLRKNSKNIRTVSVTVTGKIFLHSYMHGSSVTFHTHRIQQFIIRTREARGTSAFAAWGHLHVEEV